MVIIKIKKDILKEELKRIMGKEPIFYLKFSEKEAWVKDVQNGKLFMNTVQYFRDLEEKMLITGQGDKYELKQKLELKKVRIIDKETDTLVISIPSSKAILEIKDDDSAYLFCMMGITLEDLEIIEYDNKSARFKLPFLEDNIEKIKNDFGENVIMIGGMEFRKTIYKKINEEKIEAVFGSVTYCEHNTKQRVDAYNKQLGERFLYKDPKLDYQKEERLVVRDRFVKGNYFDVGSIKEFSYISKIEDFVKYGFEVRYLLEEI